MIKKEKSCGCVVFNQSNEVLLVKMHQGHWSFPKGHVELGEIEIETAKRETKEETNLDCDVLDGFRVTTQYLPAKNVSKEVVFFVALTASETISVQTEEIQQAGFYSYNQAQKMITFDNDRQVLRQAYQFFINRS